MKILAFAVLVMFILTVALGLNGNVMASVALGVVSSIAFICGRAIMQRRMNAAIRAGDAVELRVW